MKQLSIYDNEFIDEFEHTQALKPSIASVKIDPSLNSTSFETGNGIIKSSSNDRKSEEQQKHPANVTEIVLTKDKIDSIQLILPMLINLHQEERWLAWIDPPIQLLKEWQKTHNDAALNDVMILRSNENLSVFELSKRALSAGTCHAVIAWTNTLNQEEFSKLETASSTGNSHGIILKSRVQNT